MREINNARATVRVNNSGGIESVPRFRNEYLFLLNKSSKTETMKSIGECIVDGGHKIRMCRIGRDAYGFRCVQCLRWQRSLIPDGK